MADAVPRSLSLLYELDGTHPSVSVVFKPATIIGKLVKYMASGPKKKKNVSDIAVYYGDERLQVTKTFADYNIGAGASLTVKKLYTLPPASPSEDEAE